MIHRNGGERNCNLLKKKNAVSCLATNVTKSLQAIKKSNINILNGEDDIRIKQQIGGHKRKEKNKTGNQENKRRLREIPQLS